MSQKQDDDGSVVGIGQPKSTSERWEQYKELQQEIEDKAAEIDPAMRSREEGHIVEKGIVQEVNTRQAAQNAPPNETLAAYMGEDGFDKDSYQAPIEGLQEKNKYAGNEKKKL